MESPRESPLGTLEMIDGRPMLRFERRLAHPPRKVWRAVTEPGELAHWFPATIIGEAKIGAPLRFEFDGAGPGSGFDPGYGQGEVLECDPPHVYAFRWFDSVLRFEIVPDGSGCLLVFSQWLGGVGTRGDRPSAARQAPGWDICLDALTARLDGRPAPGRDRRRVLDLTERYVERFGLAEGELLQETDDRDGGGEHGGAAGCSVRFERDLTAAREDVWALLVEGAEPAAGERPPARAVPCRLRAGVVTAVEPAALLEYTWSPDPPAGPEPEGAGARAERPERTDRTGRTDQTERLVRIELRPQEPIGTRLVVTQTVPGAPSDVRPVALAAWQAHLEWLFALVFGDERPRPARRTEELEARYRRRTAAAH